MVLDTDWYKRYRGRTSRSPDLNWHPRDHGENHGIGGSDPIPDITNDVTPYAQNQRTTNNNIGAGGSLVLNWTTANIKRGQINSNGNGIQIVVPGLYFLIGFNQWSPGTQHRIDVLKNGVAVGMTGRVTSGGDGGSQAPRTQVVWQDTLDVDDELTLEVFNTSATTETLTHAELMVSRIGP